ncbi:MAG: phage tail protein, partial [Bacillota bacterium]
MPMAIPIVIGAGSGFLSSTVPAVVAGTAVNWTAVGAMTAIGAGMGALGLLLQPDRGDSNNNTTQRLATTNSRNIPVPVLYGKAKMSGNWLALGNFFVYKDAKDGTPGVRLREIHAFLGLCEGPVQKIENFKIDDKTIKEQLEETELEDYHFRLVPVLGTRGQKLPAYLSSASERKKYGFDKMADPVPWRNTAYVICGVNVGQEPRFPEIVCEVTGPDLSIWHKGQTGDTAQGDVVRSCHYDGHSESFYATLSSSDRTGPFGLLRTPRWRGIAQHTQPPASVTKNIQRAWYLGKHDVLVMQDPDDPATFHIGYWLITPTSGDWEKVRPDPGYGSPILKDHLDELNGHLHTLHKGSSGFYVMRWNLLTGWITRLDLDVSSSATVTLFLFAPDFDAYIIGTKDRRLILLDANTGKTYHSTTKLHTDSAKGLCISGNLVGLLYDGGIVYYDPFKKTTLRRYGSNGSGYASAGNLGGSICLAQNTWTGHLTIVKSSGGSAVYINAIPSIPEPKMEKVKKKVAKVEKESRYINGRLTTVSKTVCEEKEVWEDHTDYIGGWTRDWSYRLPGSYSYHGLEGISSLAAAMWSTLVDEPSTGSARWGAGLSRRYFSLSSFECLHAYAVGTVLYPYKKTTRYIERYRFDYLLDGERTVADLMANEMLLAVNGFRTLIDGKLYVSPQRTALASAWHFTPHQTVADSGKVTFTGRASSANRVRVEFADASDDYRRDFGEANDEYDENARGRVVTTNLAANGVTRLGHARNLAQQLCDALASNRRQVTFKTHWIGFVLSPGDGIEVSDEKLGLSRFLGRVTSISENENNEIEITAVEHQPVRDYLASSQWGSDEDETASCAALATSAEYRHGLCMSPMHAAVFEDDNEPRLVPVAGLSPKSKFAEQLRVDYKFDDDAKWTSLGKMDSSFGGFVVGNVSAKSRTLVIDGLHGTPERKILGDLPVMLARHEALGPQSPRPVGGDEAALATTYVTANHAFGARRPDGQTWTAEIPAIAYAYRVHAVSDEDGCFQPALYVQGLDACDDTSQDAYIPLDQVPSFPFYFKDNQSGRSYVVRSDDAATDEPGPILADWSAIMPEDVCPYVCGCEVLVENGQSTLNADVRLRALGRFYDAKSWAHGIGVLGDQTLQCELWDANDSYFYNRVTLFYPLVNGKPVSFDNGQAFLDSRDGMPPWGLTRAPLTVKQGDVVSFIWECWNVSDGAVTSRILGPVTLNLEPLGTPVTAGLPANAWY